MPFAFFFLRGRRAGLIGSGIRQSSIEVQLTIFTWYFVGRLGASYPIRLSMPCKD